MNPSNTLTCMKDNSKSRIMRQANMLTNQSPANGDRSYAMRAARKIENLRERLRKGSVLFVYVKGDGTRRVALGTLSPELIPADKMPKSTDEETYKTRLALVTYYDLDAHGWRSFYFFSLLGFVEEVW